MSCVLKGSNWYGGRGGGGHRQFVSGGCDQFHLIRRAGADWVGCRESINTIERMRQGGALWLWFRAAPSGFSLTRRRSIERQHNNNG